MVSVQLSMPCLLRPDAKGRAKQLDLQDVPASAFRTLLSNMDMVSGQA
jgi:hypothetical protein